MLLMPPSTDQRTKQLYEFGPFRLDPEKEILLREGQPVPLTPKTFQILLVLVRHSSEIVAKDDLLKMVWPDTFVEEANLSRNVFMLRKALGETPQDHRYIVTVPGQGYRFAEHVLLVPERELSIVAASHTRMEVQVRNTHWYWVAVAVVVLLTISVGAFRVLVHRPTVLTEKDKIVLADFVNSTDDPVFDGTLREGMAVQLEESPFLSVVSDARIQETLRLMGRPGDAHLTPEIAYDLCQRTQSAVVVDGSIANFGSQYVLGLKAVSCRTGDSLVDEQERATGKEQILAAMDKTAVKLRERLGESLSTIQTHDTPLEEATTPSLEALKAYSRGWKSLGQRGEEASIPFFKNAVDIDANFASAYTALALMYGATGSSDLATKNITRAYELRTRASDGEKFFITAYYFGRGTGNQEKAQETCDEWAQTYPRVFLPHAFLAGFVYPVLANYAKGAEEARKAIDLDPDKVVGYLLLGNDSIALNRLADAKDAVRRASQRKAESPLLSVLRYDIAFLENDRGGMEKEVKAAQGHSDAADWMLDREAFASASSGQLGKTRELSHQAVELAQQAGNPERAALFEAREALWEAFFRNSIEARRGAKAALTLARNREVEYGAAVALAMSEGASDAESIANDMEKRYPEDTSVRFNYVPVIRALVALSRNDSPRAIDELRKSAPYELGSPRSAQTGFFGSLYPVYVRGLAYLSARNGGDAAREFQKILDHRGIMIGDPVVNLAYLASARASVLAGDKTKARAEYKEFLSLWKDADPNIPTLKQAKTEFATLK